MAQPADINATTRIGQSFFVIRGHGVMMDADVAALHRIGIESPLMLTICEPPHFAATNRAVTQKYRCPFWKWLFGSVVSSAIP
jgi:hypothetical protein